VLAEAIRSAPPKVRRSLGAGVLVVAASVVMSVGDAITGTDELELFRLASIVVASAGYVILLAARVLHVASQAGTVACGGREPLFVRMRSVTLDRIFMALPMMAMATATLIGISLGLYSPSLVRRPITLIVAGFFLIVLWLAFRTAAHTSQFLYGEAERQATLAARAQAEATAARLAALQAQLNPHFLFNALNTVASLVRTSPGTAETTVEHLADVLRRTLARTGRSTATVAEEVEYVKAYLGVEQQRWGDRLRVEWDVAPDTLGCEIPSMTLQPLVENALRHGLGAQLQGGTLRIGARRDGNRLRLTVTDDGAGFPARWHEGTGLANLRRRLATLYGEGTTLTVEPRDAGAQVRVILPVAEA
jgi:sensor histidine kinase YesM